MSGRWGHQSAQVDLHLLVVLRVLIGQAFPVGIRPPLGRQEFLHLAVRREDGGSCPHFRAHVGNGGPLGHLQRRRAGAHILIDLAQTALDRFPPQHLQNDFLGVDAGLQCTHQIHLDHLGHFQTHGHASHGRCHVHAAHADAEHPDGAAVGGVAVAAHGDLSRDSESGHMDRMADAVAGPGHINAELFGGGLQIDMVVRSHVVHIEQIVVQIADGALRPHPGQPHRLKGQIGHDRVDVVG